MRWIILVILLAGNILYLGSELHWGRTHIQEATEQYLMDNLLQGKEQLRRVGESKLSASYVKKEKSLDSVSTTTTTGAKRTSGKRDATPPRATSASKISNTTPPVIGSLVDATMQPNAPRQLCVAFGPLPDEKTADTLVSWFQERSILAIIQKQKPKKTKFTLVYLETKNQPEIFQRLKQKNIKELWVIKEGTLSGAVSLGVFASRTSAEKRFQELKNLGFAAKKAPYRLGIDRKNPASGSRVLVKINRSIDMLRGIRASYPGRFELNLISCSAQLNASLSDSGHH